MQLKLRPGAVKRYLLAKGAQFRRETGEALQRMLQARGMADADGNPIHDPGANALDVDADGNLTETIDTVGVTIEGD